MYKAILISFLILTSVASKSQDENTVLEFTVSAINCSGGIDPYSGMAWRRENTLLAISKDFVMFWIGSNPNEGDPTIMFSIVRAYDDQGEIVIKMTKFPFGVLATLRIQSSYVAILTYDNEPNCSTVYRKF
jgi:hypothetical protein